MGAQAGGEGQDGAAARDILETAAPPLGASSRPQNTPGRIEHFRKCYLSVRTYKGEVVEARFP